MTHALLVRPNNTTERVVIKDYTDISKHLECNMFTLIPNVDKLNKKYTLFGDDEALLVEDPKFNVFGSVEYGYGSHHNSPIAGNVLVMGLVDHEGNNKSLTPEQMYQLEAEVETIRELMGEEEIPMNGLTISHNEESKDGVHNISITSEWKP